MDFSQETTGVEPTNIYGNQNYRVSWEKKMFNIDGKYYTIEDTGGNIGENKINNLISLFKDEEFKYSGNDIFTYIIGTQYIIDVSNKQMMRHPILNECDINAMHIWSKASVTVQEIETKHGIIIQQLIENYNNIINGFETLNLDQTVLHDNSVDQIYYAGEMKYEQASDTLYVNFLSGTFMTGKVDCSNPSNQVKECITNFFKNKIGISNVIIDTSCKTYITKEMTMEQLNQYVNSGIKVYVFNSKNEANEYNNKPMTISRLKAKKIMNDNMLKKFPNNQKYINDSREIDEMIHNAESLEATRYYPPSYGGKKNRKMRKYKYSRKNKNKSKKNKSKRRFLKSKK